MAVVLRRSARTINLRTKAVAMSRDIQIFDFINLSDDIPAQRFVINSRGIHEAGKGAGFSVSRWNSGKEAKTWKRGYGMFEDSAEIDPTAGKGAGFSVSRWNSGKEAKTWKRGYGMFEDSAEIDPTAVIETGAVVHALAKLGPNVYIGSGSVVGPSVRVGSSTKIGFNVSLQNCLLGECCVIHNGVCIGQDGFGHFVDEHGTMVKKPQLLKVKIGHHVEIGANTCIDRGSWRDTEIGDHTKIDNLVQIGHNVLVGTHCLLCGQVGVAGSATLGDYVVLGGKVGVRDHVSIASKVRVAAMSGVSNNLNEPGDYAGIPAVPIHVWRKSVVAIRRVTKDSNSSGV